MPQRAMLYRFFSSFFVLPGLDIFETCINTAAGLLTKLCTFKEISFWKDQFKNSKSKSKKFIQKQAIWQHVLFLLAAIFHNKEYQNTVHKFYNGRIQSITWCLKPRHLKQTIWFRCSFRPIIHRVYSNHINTKQKYSTTENILMINKQNSSPK